MKKINIHEAKTHLSRYLSLLKPGESLLICKRNVPIAEMKMIEQPSTGLRPIGLAHAIFRVPPGFFEELPEEVIASFERPE